MKIQFFKSQKQNHRFRLNQTVWIRFMYANHFEIYFRWRGKGRYVTGTIDRFSKAVGEIKEIDVEKSFAERVKGEHVCYVEKLFGS